MRVTWLPDAERRPRRVAVGEFDGVHLGHRAVIGDRDTVLTFDPHPRAVVAPDAAPKLITPLPVKADIVAGLGVRELVVIPFDGDVRQADARRSSSTTCSSARSAPRRSRWGRTSASATRRKGDVDVLRAQDAFETRVGEARRGRRRDRVLHAHPRPDRGGRGGEGGALPRPALPPARRSSSTATSAAATLGFPTANIVPDNALVYPGNGVYACRAALEEDGEWRWWPAAVSIGVRPTFVTGRGVLIEAYLIGYEGDCYGRELRLAFLDRLRGEKRFDSVDDAGRADARGHARPRANSRRR